MVSRKNSQSRICSLCAALALALLMLIIGVYAIESINLHTVFSRLVWPLARLLLFITIGLAIGQFIESAGWTSMLGKLGAPLFRFARLGTRCSAAFTAAFISGATANAMLYDFWKDGKINRYQLVMANLANQLPAFILHLPTTVFIVLPLTGWAGGLYFIITFLAALLRLILVLLFGHWRPATSKNEERREQAVGKSKRGAPGPWVTLKQKLPRRLIGVATYVVPIYIAVFVLNHAGMFEWTRQWMAHWVVTGFIPVEALSMVVLSFAAEFTSGFAAAGALLQEGVLTTKQAVLALLIGNVVAFPIRALRHQLPRLMGIFTPKLGLQLLLLGQGYRIASLVLMGSVYYIVF